MSMFIADLSGNSFFDEFALEHEESSSSSSSSRIDLSGDKNEVYAMLLGKKTRKDNAI